MSEERKADLQKLVWGAVLVTIGALLTLDNAGFEVGPLWRYSPLVLVAIGAAKIINPDDDGGRIAGMTWILFGIWLYINLAGLFGMRFGNSWPIVIIIFGIEIAARAIAGPPTRRTSAGEETNGHA